jgi:hypothetical protein
MTRPKITRHITDFAYRNTIEVEVFTVTGISLLLITILTISFQAIKAALANPIKSLRLNSCFFPSSIHAGTIPSPTVVLTLQTVT